MENEPDYSKYTLDELFDASSHINREKYGERARRIDDEIVKRSRSIIADTPIEDEYEKTKEIEKDIITANNANESILQKIQNLPKYLKIVFWIQIGCILLTGCGTVLYLIEPEQNKSLLKILDIIIPILAAIGILQKNKFIRILTLALSWIAVVSSILIIIVAITMIDYKEVVLFVGLLPFFIILIISGFTIWGLTRQESKDYFEQI